MPKALEAVRDLVIQSDTPAHKNEFHSLCQLCRKYNVELEKLERCIEEKGQGWANIFRWDDNIGYLLNQVTIDKRVVISPEVSQSSASDTTTPMLNSNSSNKQDSSKSKSKHNKCVNAIITCWIS
ncbi:hypothetical protein LENED_009552 [Lentinula edodes]|uniref:Uncharacterized protein n=1 Tax=Lentinula edodes TaxID=5353 RepID=A0A1Q3EK34_LENED|nr:hypothetical protein LENED_009552 [Lentinula edodes]